MTGFEQSGLAIEGLWRTAREVGRRPLWGPWLALGALQLLVLLALVCFAHPWLSWVLAPFVRSLAGREALHYPGFFRSLPGLYGRADLALGVLAGSLAAGWSTWLFAARWRRRPTAAAETWRELAPRAVTLILVQLPFNVLVVLFTTLLDRALAGHGGLTRRLGDLASLAGLVVLQALFLYAPALVVLERRGAWDALRRLPRTWARGFWAAALLSAVLLLLLLPLDAVGQRSDLLVSRGTPELVAWLVALQILAGMLMSFLLAGSSTLVYLGAVAEASQEDA
jgi:hypothetical protein